MAEKVLEKPICDACGVEVRPQSMFCYNCGGAVSDTIVEETAVENDSNGKNEVSDAWLREDVVEEKQSETPTEKEEVTEEISESPNIEKPTIESEKNDKKSDIQSDAKLKSAAAMRRKAKSFQAKQVEVVWEQPETSSSVKLILVVLLLVLFAVGIVGGALYLK